MPNIKTRFITNTIFFFLVYAIMAYIVLRALSMVMTHDEAYSFYNAKNFWYVETLCTGNTHWFNFLAIKTAILFGLEKTSQLRWFSLLSSGVFLTIAYFWIKSIKDIPTKVFGFTLALLNPFLIDYLSLARGYSAGLMFEALSILFYYIALKLNKRHTATLSLVFAGMAAIANFNFFYFFTAFSMVYFYKYYISQNLLFLKNKFFYFELLFTIGIIALVLKALNFITLCSNDIKDYGGDELINSVFFGYIDTLIYKHYHINDGIKNVLAFTLFLFIVGASIYGILKNKKHKSSWYSLAGSVLIIMLALTVINKWAFGVLYPTYRTALMFYPLIALVTIGFANSFIAQKKFKSVLLYSLSSLLGMLFITTLSLIKSFDYNEQADTKICFTFLDSIGAKKVGLDPELYGVYRNYYQQTKKYKFLFEGERINTYNPKEIDLNTNTLKKYEYIVLLPPYNLSFYKNNTAKLQGVKYYKNTGTIIIRTLN